jgi:putative acyl-CoA dehydrogenase
VPALGVFPAPATRGSYARAMRDASHLAPTAPSLSAEGGSALNQVPALENWNPLDRHRALCEAVDREGAGWAKERISAFGALLGSRETIAWGRQANAQPPVLRTFDRTGERIDEVDFHAAWHQLLELAIHHEVHGLAWRDRRAGGQVARAALFFGLAQVEAGVGCPLSMTTAAVPALHVDPEVAAEWTPRLTSCHYDPRPLPAGEKSGALCGMAMTEKQGGSDLRWSTTEARRLETPANIRSSGRNGSVRHR